MEVTLSCNTGLPLQQSQEISTDQNVVFVVESYDDGELDCEVTESVPEGYDAQYSNCEYTDLPWSATETCNITNTPLPVTVEATKDWVIEGSGGDSLDPGYKLKLTCEDEIVNGDECQGMSSVGVGDDYGYHCQEGTWSYKWWNESGTDDATYTAAVIPDWDGGTSCWVEESVYDDSIEIGNGCNDLHVAIAEGDECTITNTVFYEGIPALNPYGLVILTLSMLGLGFTAFRRYS